MRYVLTDHLGSPTIKLDAARRVLTREVYGPYGQAQISPTASGIGYTGHMQDGDTGLTYMQARYYDPESIRFLSTDPVRFSPGQPNHFNPYWYADGNPYQFVDPFGRDGILSVKFQFGMVAKSKIGLGKLAKVGVELNAGNIEYDAVSDKTTLSQGAKAYAEIANSVKAEIGLERKAEGTPEYGKTSANQILNEKSPNFENVSGLELDLPGGIEFEVGGEGFEPLSEDAHLTVGAQAILGLEIDINLTEIGRTIGQKLPIPEEKRE